MRDAESRLARAFASAADNAADGREGLVLRYHASAVDTRRLRRAEIRRQRA